MLRPDEAQSDYASYSVMFFRFPVLAAAAVVILAAAGGARATMPMLSSEPSPASPAACQKWADLQSGDALDMWGLNEDGSWPREVAVLRLTLTCLGRARPEIVGFGSSVGFDDAYCTKHREFGICKKRAAGKPTVSADEFVFGSSGVANSGNPAESIKDFRVDRSLRPHATVPCLHRPGRKGRGLPDVRHDIGTARHHRSGPWTGRQDGHGGGLA
ncbi:MAG: hypothetical protein JWO19_6039 [Bryobacterales bacterium]|nr:hypothetical protein [Bryobacterales bacterium]